MARVRSLKSLILLFAALSPLAIGQTSSPKVQSSGDRARREAWFLKGRTSSSPSSNGNSAELLHGAWRARLQLDEQIKLKALAAQFSNPLGGQPVWQSLGPVSFTSDPGTGGLQDYGTVSGRALAIAIDRTDSTGNTVYVGTAGGGIWKSFNAAALDPTTVTWSPLSDTQPSLVIGALAIKPDNNNIILAGTGEGDSSSDSYYGQGMLRSADAGLTWSVIGSATGPNGTSLSLRGIGFTAIAFSQDNPNLVVASSAGVNVTDTLGAVRGLYYSLDAGATWSLTNSTDAGVQVGGGTIPASATQVIFNPFTHRFYAALRNHGVYESADGANFTRMAVQPFAGLTTGNCPTGISSATCPFYRGQFAVQPFTRTMFVLAVDGSETSQGIATALDTQLVPAGGGTNVTWSQVSDFDPTLPTSGGLPTVPSGITECQNGCRKLIQGSYDLWLAAVPSGNGGLNTQLFLGTRNIYRCDLGASSNCTASSAWANLTRVYESCNGSTILSPFAHVHPNQHTIAFDPLNPNLMFFGTDGGLYRTLNGAPGDGCGSAPSPFQNLNTNLGPITEFVSFSQHPTDPAVLLAGAEHNGSSATNSSWGKYWQAVNGGDGGYNEIDPNAGKAADGSSVAAGNIWYTSNTDVSIQQCTLGTACTSGAFGLPPNYVSANIENSEVGGDAGDFFTPFKLEPRSSALLLVGTCRLWRGPGLGGTSWAGLGPISPMFDYLVTGLADAPSCGGETNIRSMAAGGPSAAININGQQYSVAKVVYVGMSIGADSSGASTAASGHIFVTRDATASPPQWTDITAGSGAGGAPVSDIVVDPADASGATVFVTVMGFGVPHVLKSSDFGGHWTNLSLPGVFPDVPTNSLLLDPNQPGTLYAGTDVGVFLSADGGQSWSSVGQGLPSVPVTKMRMFGGSKLRASTFGRGVWEATVTSGLSFSIAPGQINFGTASLGTTSQAVAVSISNTGTASLPVSSISMSGDFSESGSCSTIKPGSSCQISIIFTPSATGARNGSAVINFAGLLPATVTLSGAGVPAPFPWGATLNGVQDIPVPGDYDGDGKTDFAVWRPSNGTWYIIPSSHPNTPIIIPWGATLNGVQDIPVPGDYDGDGKTDIAVWRPSNGTWYIIPSSHPNTPIIIAWGATLNGIKDVPVPGDYDGDGKTDIAVWRPSDGAWYVIPSANPTVPFRKAWGATLNGVQDIPVPGDYDGDSKTDMAVWRPSDGAWYILPSGNPGTSIRQAWGATLNGVKDIPVPGDYDGDGKTDMAVWRPSDGAWYILPSSQPNIPIRQPWGGTLNGVQDVPLPRNYYGDGRAHIGVWRPGNGTWYIGG